MREVLKRIASVAPVTWQQGLKRVHLRRMIRTGKFTGDEPEFFRLPEWVSPGDCVLDVGANIGHYTLRLAELVGSSGRVIALEPVPESFELLAANVAYCRRGNISLLNLAASNRIAMLGMSVPTLTSGLSNYYMAHVSEGPAELTVMAVPVDQLPMPGKVSLVKVDAEGHELAVLEGMTALLQRDAPVLIVEDNSKELVPFLARFGYESEKLASSPNRLFRVR